MRLLCPVCKNENSSEIAVCSQCGTSLDGLQNLSIYPSQLFNLGLVAAKNGENTRARDLFAAVVHWCPLDQDARNALATACLSLGDHTEARRHWETVLSRSPTNENAMNGLAVLDNVSDNGAPLVKSEKIDTPDTKDGEQRLVRNENWWTNNRQLLAVIVPIIFVTSILLLISWQLFRSANQIKNVQTTLLSLQNVLPMQENLAGNGEQDTLEANVMEALQLDSRINWLSVIVHQVNNNSVRLRGVICSLYLKTLIEDLVGTIDGVEMVDSRDLTINSSYQVQSGDTFWEISEKVYGDGNRWDIIYQANQDMIPDPDMIRESMILSIPITLYK